jgi:hypothetical protein
MRTPAIRGRSMFDARRRDGRPQRAERTGARTFRVCAISEFVGRDVPGDLVILFTDGIFEVENPNAELYSHRDLQVAVQKLSGSPPDHLLNELLGEVRRFTQRTEFEDDVCMVGVEVAGGTNGATAGDTDSFPSFQPIHRAHSFHLRA